MPRAENEWICFWRAGEHLEIKNVFAVIGPVQPDRRGSARSRRGTMQPLGVAAAVEAEASGQLAPADPLLERIAFTLIHGDHRAAGCVDGWGDLDARAGPGPVGDRGSVRLHPMRPVDSAVR